MGDTFEAVLRYKQALLGDDAALTAFAGDLSDDVVVKSPVGSTTGKDALLAGLPQSRLGTMLAGAEWTDPVADGERIVLRATLGPGNPFGGVVFTVFAGASGRITRIEQDRIMAPKPVPTPIALTAELSAIVDAAPLNGTPFLVAYTDPQGQPRMAYRGTVLAFGEARNQLALWLRDPHGGMASAVAVNPKVSLFYADRPNGTILEFLGRARIVSDETVRRAIFEATIEVEQNMDWRRNGVAVIVDLDRVDGRLKGAALAMATSPAG